MKEVIDLLESNRKIILEHLKAGDKNFLSKLQEYDSAIDWLKKIDNLQLKHPKRYEIIELPDPKTGYSEYRIMNDCETDDINQWIELKIDDVPISAIMGDILITHKH